MKSATSKKGLKGGTGKGSKKLKPSSSSSKNQDAKAKTIMTTTRVAGTGKKPKRRYMDEVEEVDDDVAPLLVDASDQMTTGTGDVGGEGDVGDGSRSEAKHDRLDIDDYDDMGDEMAGLEESAGQGNNYDLIESIKAISAPKRRPIKRKEAAQNVEEFLAIKRRVNVGDGGVNKFLESVKEAGETKAVDKVSKLVSVAETSKSSKRKTVKTLEAPAERITADKVKRTVLYDAAKEEVSKWNSAVYHNRVAEQLVFPISQDKKAFKKPSQEKSEFIPVTPLEEEIAKVLYGEDYVKRKKAEMEKDPKQTDMESYMLSVEEAMATHSEMAKLRALQSYAMSKAKRQNKIKSKKYHRLLRKSKIRQQMKEFEELQKKDPEGALIKLEELDRARIQERMNLKHRNTSKWAKMQSARAKYDKSSREALADQLKISRDLTQKVQESSDEDEEDMELPTLVKSSVENPWMLKPSLQENDKLQKYYTGYKKFWDEYNKQNKTQGDTDAEDESGSNGNPASVTEQKQKSRKKAKKTNTNGDADEIRDINVNDEEIISENYNDDINVNTKKTSSRSLSLIQSNEKRVESVKESTKGSLEVNPDNFLKITKTGSSINPQFSVENSKIADLLDDSDSSNDETDQRNLIAEAFEDDDVVSEFQKKKRETIDASQPQDVDNFLPGWGSWTGKDVVENPRKRKKFVKKIKKRPQRKDDRISHVIINENVHGKVRSHQVKELPFPFTRVKDFEKTVRAPIGRTWLPEHAVKSLTTPKVITRLGATIKPISEDVLVKPQPQKKFHVPDTIIRLAKVSVKK